MVLIILATISVSYVFSDTGIIKRAEESEFKTVISGYKEQLEIKKLENIYEEDKFNINTITNIYDLKTILEKQVESLDLGRRNAADGISLIQTAEGAMTEQQAIIQRIHEMLVQLSNDTHSQEAKEQIKQGIAGLVSEIDYIRNRVAFNSIHLLNGSINSSNPYIIELGNGYFEQGNINVVIEDMSWNNLYGASEIDYTNIEETITKVRSVIQKISVVRSYLGANQNRLEDTIDHLTNLKNEISSLKDDIFSVDGSLASEQEAMQRAKSYKTTYRFLNIIEKTYENICLIMERTYELSIRCKNDIKENREFMQHEIDECILEIEREFKYTSAANQKLFNSNYIYAELININSLKLDDIDIVNINKIEQSVNNIEKALEEIEKRKQTVIDKKNEMLNKIDQETNEGESLDIDSMLITNLFINISDKFKEKIKVINGELTYIGDDEDEIKWATQLGIRIE